MHSCVHDDVLMDYAAYLTLGVSASLLRTALTHGDLLATAAMFVSFVVGICMCSVKARPCAVVYVISGFVCVA